MHERWYKQAVIYCLDVDTFQDSDGDGVGDFAGLTSRLDYLARLGVTCLWLNPIHPSPNRDDGYDVADFFGIDPRLGSLGDFAELVHQATNRGLRVIMGRSRPAQRARAGRLLRRFRAGGEHAALRAGHPPSTGAHAWQRPPAHRNGLQPPVHPSRDTCPALRRETPGR